TFYSLLVHLGVFLPSIGSLTITLLATAVIIGLAVLRIPGRFTSLIGLLFLTTVVFSLGRPILWLFIHDSSVYELTFGATFIPPDELKRQVLVFWCVGITAFFGGFFLGYRAIPTKHCLVIKKIDFLRRCFWVTAAVCFALMPAVFVSNLRRF